MSASPSPPPQHPIQPTPTDLYQQVFGGEGSDVSDLSDEEDIRPPARRTLPTETQDTLPPDDDDDDEDEDEDRDQDQDDVYQPGTVETSAKIPKFKKVSRDDNDEEVGERRHRKKKARKEKEGRSRRQREEVDGEDVEESLPVYDEETRGFFNTLEGVRC